MENGENGTKIPTISEAAREQNVRPKVIGTHIRIFFLPFDPSWIVR